MSASDLQVVISIAAIGYALVRSSQVVYMAARGGRALRVGDVVGSSDPHAGALPRGEAAAEVSVRRLRKSPAALEDSWSGSFLIRARTRNASKRNLEDAAVDISSDLLEGGRRG